MKEFFLEISSDTKNLIRVEEHVQAVMNGLKLSEETMNSVLIAVTEAVNNAIIHGNKRDIEKIVKIHSVISNDTLEIKVKDQGQGFILSNIPNPLLPENLTKDSGRGIFIIRSLVHGFKVNSYPEGTEIVMDIKIN